MRETFFQPTPASATEENDDGNAPKSSLPRSRTEIRNDTIASCHGMLHLAWPPGIINTISRSRVKMAADGRGQFPAAPIRNVGQEADDASRQVRSCHSRRDRGFGPSICWSASSLSRLLRALPGRLNSRRSLRRFCLQARGALRRPRPAAGSVCLGRIACSKPASLLRAMKWPISA